MFCFTELCGDGNVALAGGGGASSSDQSLSSSSDFDGFRCCWLEAAARCNNESAAVWGVGGVSGFSSIMLVLRDDLPVVIEANNDLVGAGAGAAGGASSSALSRFFSEAP
jgi:hypothetical protein